MPTRSRANGAAVQGYRIQRYAQGSTTAIGPGAACSGTITVLTCAENAVPGGTWQYTVTPIQGSWTGAESAKSQPVTVSTGVDTFAVFTWLACVPFLAMVR